MPSASKYPVESCGFNPYLLRLACENYNQLTCKTNFEYPLCMNETSLNNSNLQKTHNINFKNYSCQDFEEKSLFGYKYYNEITPSLFRNFATKDTTNNERIIPFKKANEMMYQGNNHLSFPPECLEKINYQNISEPVKNTLCPPYLFESFGLDQLNIS